MLALKRPDAQNFLVELLLLKYFHHWKELMFNSNPPKREEALPLDLKARFRGESPASHVDTRLCLDKQKQVVWDEKYTSVFTLAAMYATSDLLGLRSVYDYP